MEVYSSSNYYAWTEAVCIIFFFFSSNFSPLVVGNLWDVTDREIDRYTLAFLEGWMKAGSGASLLKYLSESRQAPKLKYIIGAAPVAYGVPVSLQ